MNPPDDLIELGKITGPYGLRGWVAVVPESNDPQVLKKVKKWWISRLKHPEMAKPVASLQADDLVFEDYEVIESKPHSGKVVAHLQGVEDRTLAEKFKGCRVYVSRSRFPSTPADEFYWVDLIGCQVRNLEGHMLGQVTDMMDHGAHPILVVKPVAEGESVLIPFVRAIVQEVKLADRLIVADWQLDY